MSICTTLSSGRLPDLFIALSRCQDTIPATVAPRHDYFRGLDRILKIFTRKPRPLYIVGWLTFDDERLAHAFATCEGLLVEEVTP